jgi:hypothetical protein
MRTLLSCCVLFMSLPVMGAETLKEFSWPTMAQEGEIRSGEVVGKSLKLVSVSDRGAVESILSIKNPGITSPSYAINGEIKYTDVDGVSYLEMWNYFPEAKSYFTRTMASSGPLQSIQGSSDWRQFSLPFYVRDESGWLADRPERLQLNLFLKGKGTVFIRSVSLVQNVVGAGAEKRTDGAWWSSSFGNKLGAYLGSLIGILAGIVGWIGGKGKARGFVMASLWSLLVFGLCSLVAGVGALVLRQPYMVYYPLLLLGIISTAVSTSCIRAFRKRYEEAELRRMSAIDA